MQSFKGSCALSASTWRRLQRSPIPDEIPDRDKAMDEFTGVLTALLCWASARACWGLLGLPLTTDPNLENSFQALKAFRWQCWPSPRGEASAGMPCADRP